MFDLSKLPPDISQFTIMAIQNELKSVVSPNEVATATTSETTSADPKGEVPK